MAAITTNNSGLPAYSTPSAGQIATNSATPLGSPNTQAGAFSTAAPPPPAPDPTGPRPFTGGSARPLTPPPAALSGGALNFNTPSTSMNPTRTSSVFQPLAFNALSGNNAPPTPAATNAVATPPASNAAPTPAAPGTPPPAPQGPQPGQQGYSNPGAYQNLSGWNPYQYATNATTQNLAQALGGTATTTGSDTGPYGIPPQNSIDFGDGYVGNAGLTQQWFDLYGPQRAMQMLQAGANVAHGSRLGVGTNPSLAGYDAGLTSPTTANNPSIFTGSSVNSSQAQGAVAQAAPGLFAPDSLGGVSQSLGKNAAAPSQGTSASNSYGDTLQTNPLGYTSWVQPGQISGTGTGNSMGYQSSYDPFGQYSNSNPNNQTSGNSFGNLLSLLTLLHLTGSQ